MKPHYITDFPGYSEVFRKHWVAVTEMMRILTEVMEAEGMEIPSTKQLHNMVNSCFYEVDNAYEDMNGIKEERDPLIHLSTQRMLDTVVEAIQTEIQSLKTNDDSN